MKPIHFLKTGVFKDMHGNEYAFKTADLVAIAQAYDPAVFASPIVVGHPKDNDPAFGWVKSVECANSSLQADPEKLAPEFTEMVANGRFRKVSASLFPPEHPSNPKPGAYYLRHIGFLGAAAPAIPGLKSVAFSGNEEGTVCIELSNFIPQSKPDQASGNEDHFKEDDLKKTQQQLDEDRKTLEVKEKELAAREHGIRRVELSGFVGNLIQAGKVLPTFKDDLVNLMEAIDNEGTIEFSESQKLTPLAFLKSYLEKQPNLVDLAERAPDSKAGGEGLTPTQVAEKAGRLKEKLSGEGVEISFSEAVERVSGGKDESAN